MIISIFVYQITIFFYNLRILMILGKQLIILIVIYNEN